ncbi:MAG: hypothetical protein WD396_01265 [Pseudohongiellaceae bacterium]
MEWNKKKVGKWAGIAVAVLVLIYIGQVVLFEVRLGINQPQGQSTIVIATFDDDGNRHERVLSLREIDGNAYVAANHWPRAWYNQALANPNVEVQMEDTFEPYIAVPLEGEEDAMLREEYAVSFDFRFRTGFPPRYFLRLDPA